MSTAILRAEARRVIEASGKSELWGLHVQARTVTLLIGQTSAGKTTLLHTLAVHLAEGREFLGIAPPRPLRVLYADYESTLDVFDERFSVLGQPEGLDFIHPDTLPRGRELLAELHDAVTSGRYDVVVVDPLVSAFPVKDENDNAEASAQMDEFKALARTTGAAVILVHNSGRGRDKDAPEDDPHYGRGASARGDRADVELTYRRSGKSGHGHRFLYVTKSRRRNLGERIDIEFTEGGGFRRATPRAEVDGAHCGDFTSRVLAAITEQQAETSKDVSRRQVEAVIGIARDSAESKALTRTLADLVDAGQIVKGERGLYRIAHLTDPPCDV